MRVKVLETGAIVDYEDSYALRLIEQGKAVYADGGTPVTPEPEGMDIAQAAAAIGALQTRCAALEGDLATIRTERREADVFASLYQSVAQAQERHLEYLEENLQSEIDASIGDE